MSRLSRPASCRIVRVLGGMLAIDDRFEPELAKALTFRSVKILHRSIEVVDKVTGDRVRKSSLEASVTMYEKDGSGNMVVALGLLDRVKAALEASGTPYTYEDRTERLLPDMASFRECIEAIKRTKPDFAFRDKQDDALALIGTVDRALIEAPTGWGKSFTIRMASAMFPSARILVVVPGIGILNDTYNDLITLMPGVGVVGDGKCDTSGRVIVTTFDSIPKAAEIQPDIVFIDEVHEAGAESVSTSLMALPNTRKQFGFSATPKGRMDGGDAVVEALVGPVRLTVTYQRGVETGAVVQLKVHIAAVREENVTRFNNPDNVTTLSGKKRVAYWNNSGRDRVIRIGTERAIERIGGDVQALVLTESAEHALRLAKIMPGYVVVIGSLTKQAEEELMMEELIPQNFRVPTDRQIREMQEAFKAREIMRAIATGKWRTGVDFKALNLVTVASGDESIFPVLQGAGRASRVNGNEKDMGHVLDFDDRFSKWARRRSQSRFRLYRKMGWIVPIVGRV